MNLDPALFLRPRIRKWSDEHNDWAHACAPTGVSVVSAGGVAAHVPSSGLSRPSRHSGGQSGVPLCVGTPGGLVCGPRPADWRSEFVELVARDLPGAVAPRSTYPHSSHPSRGTLGQLAGKPFPSRGDEQVASSEELRYVRHRPRCELRLRNTKRGFRSEASIQARREKRSMRRNLNGRSARRFPRGLAPLALVAQEESSHRLDAPTS